MFPTSEPRTPIAVYSCPVKISGGIAEPALSIEGLNCGIEYNDGLTACKLFVWDGTPAALARITREAVLIEGY